MKDGMICNCKQVSYADVENALHQMDSFSDVLSAFEDVQKITHCSTGCGGCHDKILDAISEIMMKQTDTDDKGGDAGFLLFSGDTGEYAEECY